MDKNEAENRANGKEPFAEREATTPELKALFKALNKVQSQLKIAKKKGYNPHFKSHYAGLAEVWEACREPLTKNGLAVIQAPTLLAGHFVLRTTLVHQDGGTWDAHYPIKNVSDNCQALGSAITYAKRYSLGAMLGVVSEDEDDDGESAENRDAKTAKPEEKKGNGKKTPKGDSVWPSEYKGKKYLLCKPGKILQPNTLESMGFKLGKSGTTYTIAYDAQLHEDLHNMLEAKKTEDDQRDIPF